MTLPVMEPDLNGALLRQWATTVDEGPFSSLCWGERIAFDNPEALTLLGALAAWTERVPLITTVVVPQLHDPVLLAKSLATGDMLSGGRLTVGVGVGGRHEDYLAVGADPSSQTMREMADRVAIMKKVWEGQKITDSVVPVGPRPVQRNGPRLLVGTVGPKTLRSAAQWADGLAGITLNLDLDEQNRLFDVGRAAWAEAGKPAPHLATSFWFAFGSPEDSRAQIHRHLRHYMNWIPRAVVDAMAPITGWAGTQDQLAEVLRGFAGIGTSEIHLIPTSSDPDQLRLAAEVAADFCSGTDDSDPVNSDHGSLQ